MDSRSNKTGQNRSNASKPFSFAAQVNSDQDSNREESTNTVISSPRKSSEVAPAGNVCLFCSFRHSLEDCKFLRSLPYPDRIRFLSSKGLCFGCLSNKHVAKDCAQRKACKFTDCTLKHPTVLHTRPREKANSDVNGVASNAADGTPEVRNAMVSLDGRPKTAMAILPVKVRLQGGSTAVTTFAFLDSGGSSTFCTEALMEQLGVSGLKTKISLTTLEKSDSLVDSFLIQNLEVSDLDENEFFSLPVLYTRTEIPVKREDIPTQEDIDQWPHLEGVYLPSVKAEIGLLIASDAPEALDPLEVKHSKDGGPYATRTRLGWAANGPLTRYPHSSHAASFFVKADTQLQQMIENFYNRDFSESIADGKTELSQDERRFMQSVEESV